MTSSGHHKRVGSNSHKDGISAPFAALPGSNNTKTSSQATSTFKVPENPVLNQDILSNDGYEKQAFNQSHEIAKDDVTPDKANENLFQLLSSLDGLTPAGLEHLMET